MNVQKRYIALAVIIVMGSFWACSSQQNSQVFGEPLSSDPQIASAQKFLYRCSKLARSYNPSVADCYSDSALITIRRTDPWGRVRVMKIPPSYYKSTIRKFTTLAKATGDRTTLSDIRYRVEGDNVRITAIRYSVRRKVSYPYSILVGRSPRGRIVILEEFTELQF